MKFNDGYWLLKDGVRPAYGIQVTKSSFNSDVLNLNVSSKIIRHRGDTLGGLWNLFSGPNQLSTRNRSCFRCQLSLSYRKCGWSQDNSFQGRSTSHPGNPLISKRAGSAIETNGYYRGEPIFLNG